MAAIWIPEQEHTILELPKEFVQDSASSVIYTGEEPWEQAIDELYVEAFENDDSYKLHTVEKGGKEVRGIRLELVDPFDFFVG